MILWEKEIDLDSKLFGKIEEKLNQVKSNDSNFTTTYKLVGGNIEDPFHQNSDVTNFYNSICDQFMRDLGLYDVSKYQRPFWLQSYNSKTDGHRLHNHFSGSEILSWVHFVKVPKQKCFYFLKSEKDKVYPKQDESKFIVFPSWALHGVDKVKDENNDRIVVSGNINLLGLYYDTLNLNCKKIDNLTMWAY